MPRDGVGSGRGVAVMKASWAEQKELPLARPVLKRPPGEGGNGQVFLAWQENDAASPSFAS